LFPSEIIEQRLVENDKLHIADICIAAQEPIKLHTDDGTNILDDSKQELVIEVQHSDISETDVMDRQQFYNTDNSNLIWIFDVSTLDTEIQRIELLNKTIFHALFPKKQHAGLRNLLNARKDANVLLDDGRYMYYVIPNAIQETFLVVKPVSKLEFLNQLKQYETRVQLDESRCAMEPQVIQTRNYKEKLLCLPEKTQKLMNNLMEMLECEKYTNLIKHDGVEALIKYAAMISQHNPQAFEVFDIWAQYAKKHYYSNYTLDFGKYNCVPLYNVPKEYLKWFVGKVADYKLTSQWFSKYKDDKILGKIMEMLSYHECQSTFTKTVTFDMCYIFWKLECKKYADDEVNKLLNTIFKEYEDKYLRPSREKQLQIARQTWKTSCSNHSFLYSCNASKHAQRKH
jgi:hypothetical protein